MDPTSAYDQVGDRIQQFGVWREVSHRELKLMPKFHDTRVTKVCASSRMHCLFPKISQSFVQGSTKQRHILLFISWDLNINGALLVIFEYSSMGCAFTILADWHGTNINLWSGCSVSFTATRGSIEPKPFLKTSRSALLSSLNNKTSFYSSSNHLPFITYAYKS